MTRHRHAIARVAVLVLAIALGAAFAGGCTGGTGKYGGTTGGTTGGGTAPKAPAGGATVSENGLAFSPTSVTVAVGETVTFVNDDSTDHIVSVDGTSLGLQAPGESKTWTAGAAGTFPFVCTIHPAMTGEIVVR